MSVVNIIASWAKMEVEQAEGETLYELVANFVMDTDWEPTDFGTNIVADTPKGVREFMFYESGEFGFEWSLIEVVHAPKN